MANCDHILIDKFFIWLRTWILYRVPLDIFQMGNENFILSARDFPSIKIDISHYSLFAHFLYNCELTNNLAAYIPNNISWNKEEKYAINRGLRQNTENCYYLFVCIWYEGNLTKKTTHICLWNTLWNIISTQEKEKILPMSTNISWWTAMRLLIWDYQISLKNDVEFCELLFHFIPLATLSVAMKSKGECLND